ncbi:MAG: PmoA family protein [Pirellulales bacterium]
MPYVVPRCRIVPRADQAFAFVVDGVERLVWRFDPVHTRPFFHPLIGPSGAELTRIGHPGAPDHDHHRGIWFAHNAVEGVDFWSEGKPPRIRQTGWLMQQEGDDAAVLGVELAWLKDDRETLLKQRVLAGLSPGERMGETRLEIQTELTPTAETLTLGKTNFGLLAVRVARQLSCFFGDGRLTDSEGRVDEPAIFGQAARWMDYSGPAVGPFDRPTKPGATIDAREGITFFDHPTNPNHPAKWHVREDGWMGASLCRDAALTLDRAKPLTLRYLIATHAGAYDATRADRMFHDFVESRPWTIKNYPKKHTRWGVERS